MPPGVNDGFNHRRSTGKVPAERVGVITCGYDEGQWRDWGETVFAWQRCGVDLAVCNSQGDGALDWWPMHSDARVGDLMIFGLAPHKRLELHDCPDGLRGQIEKENEFRDANDGSLPAAWDERWTLVGHKPGRTVWELALDFSKCHSEHQLFLTNHPSFSVDTESFSVDTESESACHPPSFQGIGVLTGGPRMRDEGYDSVSHGEVGHIVLLPHDFELPEAAGAERGTLWDPELPMRDRADDPRLRWLSEQQSEELLDELVNDLSSPEVSRNIERLRETAKHYREVGTKPDRKSVFPKPTDLTSDTVASRL